MALKTLISPILQKMKKVVKTCFDNRVKYHIQKFDFVNLEKKNKIFFLYIKNARGTVL